MSNKILFRSSAAGDLLSEQKSKSVYFLNGVELTTAKANKLIDTAIANSDFTALSNLELRKIVADTTELSDTAKSLVTKVWLNNQFGYSEDVLTDEMLKGMLCEQENMSLVQKVLKGEFRVAFKKNLQNDYITGTPDIVLQKEDYVEDIKSSFNLRTFVEAEPNRLYETQAQCYMALTGKKHFRLIYCLCKTPESIITSQKTKWFYKFNCDAENEDYINVAMQIDHNNNLIDKLPLERRIKVFEFHYDQEYIDRLYAKIKKAREYYATLELKPYTPSKY